MADGLNDARAMRVAEVMNDFRTIQHRISSFQASPQPQDYHEMGYSVLRQCHTEAQAVLSMAFNPGSLQVPTSPGEQTKRQLQRILLDASVRRFRVQKLHLRAQAAMRWVQARNAITGGQKAHAGHVPALRQAENNLRAELAGITDDRIVNDLRAKDLQKGHWLAEDPSTNTLQTYIRATS